MTDILDSADVVDDTMESSTSTIIFAPLTTTTQAEEKKETVQSFKAGSRSLCWLEAAQQHEAGRISDEEYIRHLYAHCSGTKHGLEEYNWTCPPLYSADKFAWSVFRMAARMEERPVPDSKPFESVFAAYRARDLEQIEIRLSLLDPDHAVTVRESLAYLALRDGRARTLELCLDGGLRWDKMGYWLLEEADRVDSEKHPRVVEILKRSDKFQEASKKQRYGDIPVGDYFW